MKIKTEMEIRDKVFFVYDNQIKSGIVQKVETYSDVNGVRIEYIISHDGIEEYCRRDQNEIAKRPEQLLEKHLKFKLCTN